MFQDVLFGVYQRVIIKSHVTFHENDFRKEWDKDETCFVFNGTLNYRPEEGFHCHYENNQTLIKWSWKKVSILLNDVSNYKTILRINKQRFKCKHYGKTFLAEDSVSDRRCSIARRVKQAVLELLNVNEPLSPTTVIRMLRSLRPKTVF